MMNLNEAVSTKNFAVDVIAVHAGGNKVDWQIRRGSRLFGTGTSKGYKAAQQDAQNFIASKGWKLRGMIQ